jgi:hypothetical protein
MSDEIKDKDWTTFSNWERMYKKEFLRSLTVDSAFAIYSELWDAQAQLPAKEIEMLRRRKIEELVALRNSFNLIQKKLHA